MRIMLIAELDTATVNQAVTSGRLGELTSQLLDRLEPEAAYFHSRNGRRAFTLVVDAPDGDSLPRLAEPLWQHLNARVETVPCMTADELSKGLAHLG